ncbi:MAG TPA: penicillin-binding protein activator [Burkholderiaceae bacterium]|nr:penicillin-binding protein activator [Burkholderiaceae bacterium]
MIRTITVARARHLVAALLLASVACGLRAQIMELPATPPAAPPARELAAAIALILPNQQTVFAQAAEAVRLGFFAAHEAARSKLAIQVLEVDDDAAQLQAVIGGARERGVQIVVGPLLRSGVNAVFDGGYASVPLVALNYPDRGEAAPPTMIALGLSAEAEAQYVVRVALAEFVGARRTPSVAPRFVVLAGPGPLERRIAQAYIGALRAGGEVPMVFDTAENGDRLAKLLDPNRHDAVFLALDAGAAALLRARIPRPILIFGTSLLNPGGGAATPAATALAHDLDGVRFVDMPWLVRADAAMGAGGPLPPTPLSSELARLYALGVDAYQVARRWSAGETRFTIEGMTGRLRIDRGLGPRVERTPAAAIYRNGTIEREEIGR